MRCKLEMTNDPRTHPEIGAIVLPDMDQSDFMAVPRLISVKKEAEEPTMNRIYGLLLTLTLGRRTYDQVLI
jgi:hypothetical protein